MIKKGKKKKEEDRYNIDTCVKGQKKPSLESIIRHIWFIDAQHQLYISNLIL